MNEFIDLSHLFEDSMPGFKIKNEDGSFTQYTTKIYPFLTHEQTRPKFNSLAEFEITQIEFQTSIGTYLDSPYHRHKHLGDISSITIEQTIREGYLIDVRENNPNEEVNFETIPLVDLENKAVMFNFGWDKYWGKEEYYEYPHISEEIIQFLVDNKVGMVGVDTINIDNSKNLKRPAHTKLLENDILIIENLRNLNKLYQKKFKFYAVPIKAKKVAAMPVRAFAEILK